MDEHEVKFPKLITVPEVAAILGVPVSTMHQWAARGDGPPSFKIGKHRRFSAEVVARWLDDAQRGVA